MKNLTQTTLKVTICAVLAGSVSLANAQFPSFGGFGKSTSNSGGDPVAHQEDIVRTYVGADKLVLKGQAKMAEALGLKERAATLAATADALTDGATKGNLSDADKQVSDANAEIAAKLKDNPQLDETAKSKYAEGLGLLGRGLLGYSTLKDKVSGFQSALSSASPLVLPKLAAGAHIVSTLPSNVSNVGSTLKTAVSFAKSNRIEVPKDATSAI